ncbi:hypothetical protein A2154_00995 [Candidatus Gottesmanbacteria bacterium RBG_16_43_7]|uniref:Nucleotidyl transferase domain-containing protein n=1 Tax=Candidatus Gottesmanbacteria bacterium RBG_16_43_7 TaxID=1798373 RepID=A0A1F5Z7Z8_9BACT|nr:MAG: hypothetical protein A2154_00995 [Candidatus Gottesmanbacteria bacterium RBG_16_43_7]
MKKSITAVILTGGVGKRFWPLVADKNLFPFLGKKLIERNILDNMPAEITRIVVITNPYNTAAFKSLQYPKPYQIVVQENPGGMADALLTAESELKDCSLLIYLSSHIVERNLYSDIIAAAKRTECFGVIPGSKVSYYMPLGYLKTDGNRIREIIEKPGAGNEPSDMVDITGHYISESNALIDELKKTPSDQDDAYEKALSRLMVKREFILYSYKGYSVPLKYPWHILDIMDAFLSDITAASYGRNIIIKQHVTVEGPVEISDGVKIMENSKIVGPCYIGPGTIIGNNSLIRASHIGANCVIGFGTEITRSYIGDNCWFHANFIGDSIIESDVAMGAGSVCANFRLDEQTVKSSQVSQRVDTMRNKLGSIIANGVRIGVNCTIMPGTKIGTSTFISAGCIVSQDIAENSFCKSQQELVIRKNKSKLQSDRNTWRGKIK